MKTPIPIGIQSAKGRSVPLTAENLVNCFAEQSPTNAKTPVWVHSTPGWTTRVNLQSFTERDFSGTEAAGIINEINPTGQLREVAFKADGTKMYLNIQPYTIYEYSLSTAWDLSTYAATGQTYQLAANGHGMAFKPDGTRVWATTTAGSESVHSYTLSTAWDLSTISDDSISFAPSLGGINAIQFKTDGTKMYILDVSGDINQYTLSTAWDITSAAVATGTLSLKSSAGDWNFTLSSDGITVYEVSDHTTSAKRLYSYTLSTPWDISTAGAAVQLAEGGGPTGVPGYRGNDTGGLFIAPDAGHWYTCDSFGYVYQYEYTLTAGQTDSAKRFIRGMHVTPADGKLYVVVGTTLYYIASNWTKTQLGTIGGSGPVSMADNGTQLCIVSQGISYTYTVDDGLSTITDTDFPNAQTNTFIDGFFVFNNNQPTQRGQFFISNLLDGQTYDALDFATAERYPDNLKRVFADHSELLLFGDQSIEVWFNSGGADFPFSRAQGSVIEQGLGATWSVAKIDETVMWLDNEGVVRRLQGAQAVRVSTHAIEHNISKGDWTNAQAFSYAMEGHQFYVLYIPKSTALPQAGTYVLNAATGLWHTQKSYEKDFLDIGYYAYAYGKHVGGALTSGTLYELSMDTFDEAGDPLITEIQFPQIRNNGDRFKVHSFELDMEMGLNVTENLSSVAYEYPSSPSWSDVSEEAGATGIGYGNAVFIATDATTASRSTDNGATWASVATSLTQGNAIHYADSTWVIAGGDEETGEYATSTDDGASWSNASLGSSGYLTVAYGDSLWVMAGYTGGLYTSTDASSWTSRTSGFGATNINGVAYGNGLWVAVGDSGTMYTASDATGTWTVATSSFGATAINAVAYGDGLWVAVGASGKIATSTDGASWTQTSSPGWSTDNITDVGYIDDMWYVVGGETDTVFTSTDGLSWTDRGSDTNLVADLLVGAAAGNGYLVVASEILHTDAVALSAVSTSSAAEPYVMLDVSGNTRTYDMNQPWRSAGKQGEYDNRVIWRRLGQHRSFTPRVRISFPAARSIYSATAVIEPNR